MQNVLRDGVMIGILCFIQKLFERQSLPPEICKL
jgi:hypothetical protein